MALLTVTLSMKPSVPEISGLRARETFSTDAVEVLWFGLTLVDDCIVAWSLAAGGSSGGGESVRSMTSITLGAWISFRRGATVVEVLRLEILVGRGDDETMVSGSSSSM